MCKFTSLHAHQYKKEIAAMKAAAEADLQQLQHNATLIQSLQVNMHAPRKDFSGRELLWKRRTSLEQSEEKRTCPLV